MCLRPPRLMLKTIPKHRFDVVIYLLSPLLVPRICKTRSHWCLSPYECDYANLTAQTCLLPSGGGSGSNPEWSNSNHGQMHASLWLNRRRSRPSYHVVWPLHSLPLVFGCLWEMQHKTKFLSNICVYSPIYLIRRLIAFISCPYQSLYIESASSHCTMMKPEYSRYGCCRTGLVMQFGPESAQ